ncbi:MAG TPA: AraC family transcriptional regulator [Thermoanaerobaculia bacterium]|nr:AraC family transcriptional regulator [Thermoanaerobaculia bacterium]
MLARQATGIATLAWLIGAGTPNEGTVELRLTGVHAARVSQPNQEPVRYVQQSSLCVAAQGAKIAMIGGDTYSYEAGQMALYPVDVPIAGRVTRASYAEPYLLLMIDAAARLVELLEQPVEAELLAPLVRDEIVIRLLRSPMGSRVAQIGQAGSSMQRIASAVSWLRERRSPSIRSGPAFRGITKSIFRSNRCENRHWRTMLETPRNRSCLGDV